MHIFQLVCHGKLGSEHPPFGSVAYRTLAEAKNFINTVENGLRYTINEYSVDAYPSIPPSLELVATYTPSTTLLRTEVINAD